MNKALSMLGLAQKAGKIAHGEDEIRKAVKFGRAVFVLVAEDASENTKKRFMDSCAFYKSELILWGTKDELGKATGKKERAALAVCDKGLADAIRTRIQEEQNHKKSEESNETRTTELAKQSGGELIE